MLTVPGPYKRTWIEVAADDLDPAPMGDPKDVPYWSDPVGFARDCIVWRNGRELSEYQAEIMAELVQYGREAVISLHGAGKTATAAIIVLWYATTREAAGVDWKVITTASAWRQLTQYLWPEVHKWANALDWRHLKEIGLRTAPFAKTELLDLHLKLPHGEAFAVASNQASSIEGAHADYMLYIFDESKAIPVDTWDAAEGAFSTAGEGGTEAMALAISTGGEPIGRFYEIHARRPGTEVWHTKHVGLTEALKAGRVTIEWANASKLLWGENSAVYKNRVLGQFASSDTDGVIPLEWVEMAQDRWRDLFEDIAVSRDAAMGTPAVLRRGDPIGALGVDVAGSGEDLSAVALRIGNAIAEIRRFPFTDDPMVLTGQVVGLQRGHSIGETGRKARDFPNAVVDGIGIGAGVYSRIREQRMPTESFIASAGTKMLDQSGKFGFVNKRAAAWWNLREMLDPDSGLEVALPPDDRLTSDLVSPKWRLMSGGRIQIEAKDEIRKRIGRSTDDADSVVMAFWAERGQGAAFLAYWRAEVEKRTGGVVPTVKPRGGKPLRVKREVVAEDEPEEVEEEPSSKSTRAIAVHVDRENRLKKQRDAAAARRKCQHLYKMIAGTGVCTKCGEVDQR